MQTGSTCTPASWPCMCITTAAYSSTKPRHLNPQNTPIPPPPKPPAPPQDLPCRVGPHRSQHPHPIIPFFSAFPCMDLWIFLVHPCIYIYSIHGACHAALGCCEGPGQHPGRAFTPPFLPVPPPAAMYGPPPVMMAPPIMYGPPPIMMAPPPMIIGAPPVVVMGGGYMGYGGGMGYGLGKLGKRST